MEKAANCGVKDTTYHYDQVFTGSENTITRAVIMLGEIINEDMKRLKCSAFILHILGAIFKMVELCRSKRFKFPVKKKKESILTPSRQGIPPKKVVLLCE